MTPTPTFTRGQGTTASGNGEGSGGQEDTGEGVGSQQVRGSERGGPQKGVAKGVDAVYVPCDSIPTRPTTYPRFSAQALHSYEASNSTLHPLRVFLGSKCSYVT